MSGLTSLELVTAQLANFPVMENFVNKYLVYPSVLLTPKVLEALNNELNMNPDLLHESLTFLDTLTLASSALTGDISSSNWYQNLYIQTLSENRVIGNLDNTLGDIATDKVMWESEEKLVEFLDNNKPVMSLYIFASIRLFSYGGYVEESDE